MGEKSDHRSHISEPQMMQYVTSLLSLSSSTLGIQASIWGHSYCVKQTEM